MPKYNFQMPNSPEEYVIDSPDISVSDISFSALDYKTISKLFIEYLSLYHKDKFNDFVKSNAVIMVEELVAYMGHLLSNRQDLQSNEAFLQTARTRFAVDQHLKVLNNSIKRQTPAEVEILIELKKPATSLVEIPAKSDFSTYSTDNEIITYELFKAPGNWEDPIQVFPGSETTTAIAIEGSTIDNLQYVAEGLENEQFTIYSSNILEEPFAAKVTTGVISEKWKKVDNIERYDANDKVYELIFTEDGAILKFGNNLHGSKLPEGAVVDIKYRIGGGIRGRIQAKAISETKTITINARPVVLKFTNYSPSSGGTDIEKIEDSKKRASAESFALESVVSSKDYINICKNFIHPIYGSVAKASVSVKTGVEYNIKDVIGELRAESTDGEFILDEDEAEEFLLDKYVNKNIIEVYILTHGTNKFAKPSEWLKQGLKNYLESIGPITDEVRIYDGNFKNIDLGMDIVLSYNSDVSVVKSDINNTINDFFSTGGFEIGDGFYLSKLYSSLQSINGIYQIRIKNPNYDIVPIPEIVSNKNGEIGISEIINLNSININYYRKSN